MIQKSSSLGRSQDTLPGADDVHRAILPNGITILCRTNFNSPSIFISGYLPAGGIFDPEEKLGLADFTASALMRGTSERSLQQIYDALESCGAGLSYGSGMHTSGFNGRALVEDLPLLLDILGDTLRQPTFPEEQVERLRARLLTGLALRAQDTADMAALTFDQILFKGHPYAHPTEGWPATIQSIQRDDLVNFHRHAYGPRGLVIAVTGAMEAGRVVEQVQVVLGSWNNPDQLQSPELPPLKPLKRTFRQKVTIPGKSQSNLVIGTSAPARRDPDFMSASLGNSILGQFGMMGRIGEVVREKSGLAYSAYSTLNSGLGPGSWEISAGVNPANVERAANLIRREIKRFIDKGVSIDELADSQANFIGRLPLSLESNAGVANALLTVERFELDLDYYRQYAALVQAVTPEQVMETARSYFHPDALVITVAGP